MQKEMRTFVAHTAARLSAGWSGPLLWDKQTDAAVQVDAGGHDFSLQRYPFKQDCKAPRSRDGENHCLVAGTEDHHVCLSVYGNLFDGCDQQSASHFSGMVYDDAVEIYDYSTSEFYRFEKI